MCHVITFTSPEDVGVGSAVAVSVTDWDAVWPPVPMAVAVYVVVFEGEIVMPPEAGGCTLPTPLSMVTLLAFVVDQTSFALCPALIVFGFTESAMVGTVVEAVVGAGAAVTVTVTVALAAPPLPRARKVYVVVFAGFTVSTPFVATFPK
jgi:hypothetical protein